MDSEDAKEGGQEEEEIVDHDGRGKSISDKRLQPEASDGVAQGMVLEPLQPLVDKHAGHPELPFPPIELEIDRTLDSKPGSNLAVSAFFSNERSRIIREAADDRVERNLMLSRLVTHLKGSVSSYDFPWNRLRVPADTAVVLKCYEKGYGSGLTLAIKKLQVEHLTGRAEVVILMRDELNEIPETAHESWKAIESFRANGGHFETIPVSWLADFEALRRLQKEVEAGRLLGPDGTPVGIAEVIHFVKTEFRSGLVDRLREILDQSP